MDTSRALRKADDSEMAVGCLERENGELRDQLKEQVKLLTIPISANVSSATCRGCGRFEQPEGDPWQGYYILGNESAAEPWHYTCATKALHAVQEQARVIAAIINASDGCQGHRHCNHDMKPWENARALLKALSPKEA